MTNEQIVDEIREVNEMVAQQEREEIEEPKQIIISLYDARTDFYIDPRLKTYEIYGLVEMFNDWFKRVAGLQAQIFTGSEDELREFLNKPIENVGEPN